MDLQTALTLAQTFGVSFMILCVVGWALWRILNWVRDDVGKPLVGRLIRFIDGLDEKIDAHGKALQNVVEDNAKVVKAVESQTVQITKLVERNSKQ